MFHAIVAHFFLEVAQFCCPKRNNPTRADKARVGLGRCGRRGAARGRGAQEGAGQLAAKGERHGAMGTGRAIAVERRRRGSGAQEGAGTDRRLCAHEAGSEARTATTGAAAGTTAVVAGLHGTEVVAGTLAARMAFGALG